MFFTILAWGFLVFTALIVVGALVLGWLQRFGAKPSAPVFHHADPKHPLI